MCNKNHGPFWVQNMIQMLIYRIYEQEICLQTGKGKAHPPPLPRFFFPSPSKLTLDLR